MAAGVKKLDCGGFCSHNTVAAVADTVREVLKTARMHSYQAFDSLNYCFRGGYALLTAGMHSGRVKRR